MDARIQYGDVSNAERHQIETELGVELIPGTEVMTE